MNIFLNENILISQEPWITDNVDEVLDNLSKITKCLHCFNFHVEPTVLYSGNGLKNLFENFKDIEFLTDYSLTNPLNMLRLILRDIEAVNWDLNPHQRADHMYFFLSEGGAKSHYVNNTTIAEAAEYSFNNNEVGLLNLMSSEFNETNPIHINRSSINPPPNITTVAIKIITSKPELITYVMEKRSNRNFNWNPKHGENNKGVKQNKGEAVSPLECSKEEAELLLPKAVGYRGSDELYAYDIKIQKFMVFKSENTTHNSYHPYHPINQNEVPRDVKAFLTTD